VTCADCQARPRRPPATREGAPHRGTGGHGGRYDGGHDELARLPAHIGLLLRHIGTHLLDIDDHLVDPQLPLLPIEARGHRAPRSREDM
jgi:hypothetical protein